MSNQYIKEERTADDLIRVLENPDNIVLLGMIKEYFQAFCDCDVRVWIIQQINLGGEDNPTILKIKELIASNVPVVSAPPLAALKNPDGYLLSAACVSADMVGTFADGSGGTYEQPLVENSPDCSVAGSLIEDSLTDSQFQRLRQHTPEIGLGYTTQLEEFPNGTGAGSTFGTIYDKYWRMSATGLKMIDAAGATIPRPLVESGTYADNHVARAVLANDTVIRSTNLATGITLNTRKVGQYMDYAPVTWLTLALEIPHDDLATVRDVSEALYVSLAIRTFDDQGQYRPGMGLYIHTKNGAPYEEYSVVRAEWFQDDFTWQWEQLDTAIKNTYSVTDVRPDGQNVEPVWLAKMIDPANPAAGRKIDFSVTTSANELTVFINEIPVRTIPYAFEGNAVPVAGYHAGFGFETLPNDSTPARMDFDTWVSDYYVRDGGDTAAVWDVGVMVTSLSRDYHQNPSPSLLVPASFYDPNTFEINRVVGMGQNSGDPPGHYIPFMIAGFPTIDGVVDKGHITFDWYDFPSEYLAGVRQDQLLTTRQDCVAKGTIAYDELTGIGVVTWTTGAPPASSPRWTMLAISYKGQEIFSIQCIPAGPDTPNAGIEVFALSAMSEHNVLMRYPYTGYYTNFP